MTKSSDTLLKDILSKTDAKIPKAGEAVEGKAIEITKEGLFVDLENFKTGLVPMKELREYPEYSKLTKSKDNILVKIIQIENEEGYVEISLRQANSEQSWSVLKEKMDNGEIISSKVLKANKGGLIMDVEKISAFMPVSQLSRENYPRVEGDSQKILQALQKLVGKEIKVKVLDVDENEEKLIVSEKVIYEKEIQETIKNYKIGDTVEGVITGVVDFGIFIKFNDLEGLVHISELAYQLVKNPSDLFKVGDKAKAKVIEIDKNKISLSIKALQKNPWEDVENKYKVGQTVKGTVTNFNPFGVFVQLDKNIHGLAHISEFGTEEKMKESLEIDKKYDFKILSIKPKEYRMALKLA